MNLPALQIVLMAFMSDENRRQRLQLQILFACAAYQDHKGRRWCFLHGAGFVVLPVTPGTGNTAQTSYRRIFANQNIAPASCLDTGVVTISD